MFLVPWKDHAAGKIQVKEPFQWVTFCSSIGFCSSPGRTAFYPEAPAALMLEIFQGSGFPADGHGGRGLRWRIAGLAQMMSVLVC